MCVDLEWNSHKQTRPLSLVQVACNDVSFVLDAVSVPKTLHLKPPQNPSLKELFESKQVTVVMHGANTDREILAQNKVHLRRLFDTQTAHYLLTGEAFRSLRHVVKFWLGIDMDKGGAEMKKFLQTPGNQWEHRPLPDFVLTYSHDDVRFLPQLYEQQYQEAEAESLLDQVFERSLPPDAARKFKGTFHHAKLDGGFWCRKEFHLLGCHWHWYRHRHRNGHWQ